jgi:hypothetical protein
MGSQPIALLEGGIQADAGSPEQVKAAENARTAAQEAIRQHEAAHHAVRHESAVGGEADG